MKPSDIENGVEVCRLIALLTTGEQESIIIDHEAVCVQWFEWVKDDSAWFASRGETLLECLVKAAIRRKRLVICGEFIEMELFEDMAEFSYVPWLTRAWVAGENIGSEDRIVF